MQPNFTYVILRYIVRQAFKVFYKNLYLIGNDSYPNNKPIAISPNHTNALLDPMVLGANSRNILHFLTRGDIFKGKAVLWLFDQLNMLPIFRQRDGLDNMKKNEDTFLRSENILKDKGNLIIFTEGDCFVEKRVRGLQKGMARICFNTVEKYGRDLDIHIVPVGINYTRHVAFRSDLMVRYDQPIPLRNYYELYDKNPAKAINKLNQDVAAAMRRNIVHIEDPANDSFVEQYLDMYRNNQPYRPFPLVKTDPKRLDHEIGIANYANQLATTTPHEWAAAKQQLTDYQNLITQYRTDDLGVAGTYNDHSARTLGLLLGLPLFLIGAIGNALPAWLALQFTRRLIKGDLFYATVLFASGMVFTVLYWLILGIVATILHGALGAVAVASVAYLGTFALIYAEHWRIWRSVFRFNTLRRRNPDVANRLRADRASIVSRWAAIVQ